MKFLLFLFSIVFDFITSIRNILFDLRILKSETFNIPIICVGNLSMGGNGKTPHVDYIIKKLSDMYNIAVISRGYKRKNSVLQYVDVNSTVEDVGDEPLMIKKRSPETTVIVSNNKAKAITEIVRNKPEIDLVLLDDGYQHRWIKPGLNLLLTNSDKPFYDDNLFPLGNLRENRKQYKRADFIIITNNTKEIDEDTVNEISSNLPGFNKDRIIFSRIEYQKPIHIFDKKILENFEELDIILITGIANATPLLKHIKSKSNLVHHMRFNDHHNYTSSDINNIVSYYSSLKSAKKIILTTEKDSVKLIKFEKEFLNIKIFYLPIEIELNKAKNFEKKLIEYVGTN